MTQAIEHKLTAFGETLKRDSKEHNPIRPAAAKAIVEHWGEIKAIMRMIDDPEFAEYDRLKRKFEGALCPYGQGAVPRGSQCHGK